MSEGHPPLLHHAGVRVVLSLQRLGVCLSCVSVGSVCRVVRSGVGGAALGFGGFPCRQQQQNAVYHRKAERVGSRASSSLCGAALDGAAIARVALPMVDAPRMLRGGSSACSLALHFCLLHADLRSLRVRLLRFLRCLRPFSFSRQKIALAHACHRFTVTVTPELHT